MAQVWMCDRCDKVSKSGDVDDPPEDWQNYDMPCRGSEGARSRQRVTICSACDDSLYDWLRTEDDDPCKRCGGLGWIATAEHGCGDDPRVCAAVCPVPSQQACPDCPQPRSAKAIHPDDEPF